MTIFTEKQKDAKIFTLENCWWMFKTHVIFNLIRSTKGTSTYITFGPYLQVNWLVMPVEIALLCKALATYLTDQFIWQYHLFWKRIKYSSQTDKASNKTDLVFHYLMYAAYRNVALFTLYFLVPISFLSNTN